MVNRVCREFLLARTGHAILMPSAVTIALRSATGATVMGAMRHFLLIQHRIAFVVIVMALAMKALVPAGFMVETRGHILTIAICADASRDHVVSRQIIIPGKPANGQSAQGKSGEACPFSALSIAGLSGADPALLAAALAFILLLGILPVATPRLVWARRIRPPLRAPPVLV